MQSKDSVPVTVLTGYLGAGKTTLLNHVLAQKHGYRCAVIINEFGPVNIDNKLVVGVDEEITELNNGCLCCRVRGDLIRSLNDLFQKQKRFDYVLIETTGLADPGPIAHTFMASELADRLRLDGIVTVIDALNFEKELQDGPEARAQVGFADVLLLNKTDLVSPKQLDRVEQHLRSINLLARIHRTERSGIDLGQILNIHARDLSAPLNVPAARSEADDQHDHDHEQDHEQHHEHKHEHEADEHAASVAGGKGADSTHHHQHDEDVHSVYLLDERPLELRAVEAWLTDLMKTVGPDIYRAKGILYLKGQAKRVVFQGVQMLFDARPDRLWQVSEKRQSQLVFIGKDLDEAAIRAGFERCIAP